MSRRISRVSQVLKEELGRILTKEIEFPLGSVATITRVETASNLQEARVYISVVPDNKQAIALRMVRRNIFDIQQLLNRRLKIRPVPKIIFIEEKKTKEAARIEELLEDISHKDG